LLLSHDNSLVFGFTFLHYYEYKIYDNVDRRNITHIPKLPSQNWTCVAVNFEEFDKVLYMSVTNELLFGDSILGTK